MKRFLALAIGMMFLVLVLSSCFCIPRKKVNVSSSSSSSQTESAVSSVGGTSSQSESVSSRTSSSSAVSGSINMGKYNGKTYTNSFFGLSFTAPEGWTIASEEVLTTLYNKNYFDLTQEELQDENTIYFTMVSKYSYGYVGEFNSNFQLGCDKITVISPSTVEEYLDFLESELEDAYDYEFGNVTKQTIDGVEFSVVTASGEAYSQTFYMTKRNGYYIYFISTFESQTDKQTLNSIISTVDLT